MTILITCATGKTPRRVAALLRASSHPLLLASRSGTSIEGSPGVAWDYDVPEKWDAIFEHEQAQHSPITAVYLLVRPVTVDVAQTAIPFIDFLRRNGVQRIVQLSGSSLTEEDHWLGEVHAELVRLHRENGLDWGVVRSCYFMENFSEVQHQPTIRENSVFYTAAGDGKIPFVSCDDVARVAAHILTAPECPNRDYIVVGIDLLSYNDVAEILSDVLGRKITRVVVTREDIVKALVEYPFVKVPRNYAELLADVDEHVASGKEAHVDDAVERLTGKKPICFRDFAEKVKHVWL